MMKQSHDIFFFFYTNAIKREENGNKFEAVRSLCGPCGAVAISENENTLRGTTLFVKISNCPLQFSSAQ